MFVLKKKVLRRSEAPLLIENLYVFLGMRIKANLFIVCFFVLM